MMGPRYWHSDARAKDGGFWVEHINPLPPQTLERLGREFAKVPLHQAAKLAKAADMPGAMVLVVLFYLAWKHKGAPFPFPNTGLTRLGINRWAKYRLLKTWEAAGLVKVDWRNKRSPRVTILTRPTRT